MWTYSIYMCVWLRCGHFVILEPQLLQPLKALTVNCYSSASDWRRSGAQLLWDTTHRLDRDLAPLQYKVKEVVCNQKPRPLQLVFRSTQTAHTLISLLVYPKDMIWWQPSKPHVLTKAMRSCWKLDKRVSGRWLAFVVNLFGIPRELEGGTAWILKKTAPVCKTTAKNEMSLNVICLSRA